MPPPRGYHGSVVLNDRLFVWGGKADTLRQHSCLDLFSVHLLTGEWCQQTVTSSGTVPPCNEACTAAIGNTMYSYGGKVNEGIVSDELYKLNPKDMRCMDRRKNRRIKT